MKAPKPRGKAITLARKRAWVKSFGAYRHPVDVPLVHSWLGQFASADQDLAARVLDAVDFMSTQGIAASFRTGLQSLNGWNANPAQRQGTWRFCPWSTSSGESGDSMLHNFRITNGLSTTAHRDLFIYPADIVRARLGPSDSLVFVNDFVGTGSEVCEAWRDYFSELTAGIGNVYLLVSMGCTAGRQRVAQETAIQVVSGHELSNADNLFSKECKHFNEGDKATLLSYAAKADKKRPKGFGDCGLLVVFQHRCPNNSVAFLHAASPKWEPLFPRHE